MVKTNNTEHLGYASYSRGTETAKVEGLWLCKDPKACDLNTQMTVIAAAELLELGCTSPFIVPSLYHMRDPHDIIL